MGSGNQNKVLHYSFHPMTLKQNKNETVNVVIYIIKMVNISGTLSEFYLRSNFGDSNDVNH